MITDATVSLFDCREEGAQTLIEQMTRDLDPIIRYGGMFTIALAYRGTANNAAVQQLLHFAVSDVNDNVRRAAVLCLGFLLLDSPQQCPRLVSLLVRRSPCCCVGSALQCEGALALWHGGCGFGSVAGHSHHRQTC